MQKELVHILDYLDSHQIAKETHAQSFDRQRTYYSGLHLGSQRCVHLTPRKSEALWFLKCGVRSAGVVYGAQLRGTRVD